MEKIHAMMLKTPGSRGLLVRKTAISLTSTALVTWREHVAKEALESGELRFYGGSAQEAASYQYGNGSVVVIGGMDKASRIMSSEYDAIYVQEATELTEDDWEALTTRLRNGRISFQQLMADCNPDAPHHWLKRRCDRGACRMIYCRHEDNPRLYDAESGTWSAEGTVYVERLDALTGVRRERLRFGRWAAAEGLVYESFDPLVHLSTRFNRNSLPPKDWPRYLAVDFGYRNPFVLPVVGGGPGRAAVHVPRDLHDRPPGRGPREADREAAEDPPRPRARAARRHLRPRRRGPRHAGTAPGLFRRSRR